MVADAEVEATAVATREAEARVGAGLKAVLAGDWVAAAVEPAAEEMAAVALVRHHS